MAKDTHSQSMPVGGQNEGEDDVFWSAPHDDWKPAPIPEIACDSCNKLPGAQAVHQTCNKCGITVCRGCVADGKISRFPSHVPHEVGDFSWAKASSSNQPATTLDSAGGSLARGLPSAAIPILRGPATTLAASSTKGNSSATKSSSKKGDKAFGKDSASHLTQTTIAFDNNSFLTLSTPTKVKNSSENAQIPSPAKGKKSRKPRKKNKKKGKKISHGSDSDFAEMDAPSNKSSDKEYVPPAEISRKRSTPSLGLKKGNNQVDNVATDANIAPIGLAQSRPVRAAAINTYEKMRNANVKKEPEALDEIIVSNVPEVKKTHPPKEDLIVPTNAGQNARLGHRDSSFKNIQDYGYAQQGQVQGGSAYLYAPQYGEGYRHRGLPQLHPGAAYKAKTSHAGEAQVTQSHTVASPATDNKRGAATAEQAPASKRQNTNKMPSPTSSMSSMSAGTAGVPEKAQAQAPLKPVAPVSTPEERAVSRLLVTTNIAGLMNAIQNKVKLHIAKSGVQTHQQYDLVLREVIHSAWVTNIALTQMKRQNGELAAIQLLRGYANVITSNLGIADGSLTKNWLDGTDYDIQSKTATVPNSVRIDEVKPVAQDGLNYPIEGRDVHLANLLMFMKTGGE
ncbi:hypothetical protein CORC01_06872 [Colletotrichum orchidophilum]|uniref:Uncharacterized protein n=1 Tax=Colletotrichum orchidophilum TaxID=1209926 RepID=A0A1G4B8U0_9PEZI|nr:uncharacterized protein CORC01_06872 [Colletotrichum orchidophilum]OHE97837.1 hypothetical protein CORC01_06872 [Colletotrichum orchidophilum]